MKPKQTSSARIRVAAWRRARASLTACAAAAFMAACGGGSSSSESASSASATSAPPTSRAEAQRFLTQSTFGPSSSDTDHVMAVGYAAWIDEQVNKPSSSTRLTWEALDAAAKAVDATASAGTEGVTYAFWKAAIAGDDQLRQRVAFALSEIFVISLADGNVGNNPRGAASYYDMLAAHAFGNYRDLLESVSLHPMMGYYLTSIRNQKDDPRTGRVPDQNYAREVMQLFSIGLDKLNIDGTPQLVNGAPVDTYGPPDVMGLSRVFTGFSWACPAWPDNGCFFNAAVGGVSDPDRMIKSMMGYPQYHSTDEKSFLGTTVSAQSQASPSASLKTALDTLANHPNVAPFISKQLIQRLVTSNPSPAYVAAVAAVFNDNGQGTRGDLKAVVRAILLHPEARTTSSTAGKVREPILRLSAYLRAFPMTSDSGNFKIGNTDNAGSQLGQTALRSPSVFNFYRPGYVPPGTRAAAQSLRVPEMQLADETTAAGYVNFMRDVISGGAGVSAGSPARRDVQPDFTAELALAAQPHDLVARINDKLMCGGMPDALATEIETAITKITIPTLNAQGTNQATINAAKRNRVNAAILLTVASPEFIVQK